MFEDRAPDRDRRTPARVAADGRRRAPAVALVAHVLLLLLAACMQSQQTAAGRDAAAQPARGGDQSAIPKQSGYADVNGLQMYYEVYGTVTEAPPLVLLHGAYMTLDMLADMIPILADGRPVVAAEMQGHGRTADIDRPITYEAMADDVAGLLDHLGIARADVFGYSMGGGVALQVALRHPASVRKLIVASASYTSDGVYPELWTAIEEITPETFAGTPFEESYLELAPNPEDFPVLVEKLKALDAMPFAWPEEAIAALDAPTLVVVGDSDIVTPEHAVALFKLRGGGVPGDLVPLPASQLAVLPGTNHLGVMMQLELVGRFVAAFLDAPAPDSE